MDSYFELKALPNPEIIQSEVMANLMQVLHQHLPSMNGGIGVDFPAYGQQRTLGGIIRLLGDCSAIKALHKQLQAHPRIQDYALVSDPVEVPSKVHRYVRYYRRPVKNNSDFKRLKKRHQARGTWSAELEQSILQKYALPVSLPHLILKSTSTRQEKMMLFIERKQCKSPVSGKFNSYGLGAKDGGATLPLF